VSAPEGTTASGTRNLRAVRRVCAGCDESYNQLEVPCACIYCPRRRRAEVERSSGAEGARMTGLGAQ
jgi:4-diphosphocytidyl-2C-methyl-D-erythritol kinase